MPSTLYSAVVFVHVAVGTIALLSFWTAGFARKGSPLHRTVGRVFLLAMCGIGLTAVPMAAVQFARGNPATGVFLAYLIVLTATASLRAWFAIRRKRDAQRFYGRWYRGLALANLGSAAGVLACGLATHALLLTGFSVVGFGIGLQMWRSGRGPLHPRWWLREHYRGMLGNGVATHVAFLSIGFGRLLPAYAGVAQTLAWFGPLAVSIAVGFWLKRRYGFNKPLAQSPVSAA
ncbi:MAG: hypothetical protein ACREVL_07970 [Solimonas sp.]